MSEILVTGFSSFVTRRLVHELLLQGNQVTVLVRPPQRADAEAALARGVEAAPSGARGRTLLGDVVQMDLGLAGADVRRVMEEVEVIYHCAAVHPRNNRHEEAWRVNVEGTRTVVELALECDRLTRFNALSSAFVSGDRTGVVLEDELDHGQRFRSEFERTKFEAEKLIRRAAADMPVTIFRPGLVVSDGGREAVFRDDPHQMMLAFLHVPFNLAVPLPGKGDHPLHLVPVDYVARAMATLGRDPRAAGLTFHLTDPNPLPARRVMELIADHAHRRRPSGSIPVGVARSLLKLPFLKKLGPPQRVVDYFEQLVIYNTTNTLRLLEGTGVQCPPFDSIVGDLVNTLTRIGGATS